jgi:hypothetical protein
MDKRMCRFSSSMITKLTPFSASVRLSEYPTGDLFQLYAVVRFFRGILEGVPVGDEDHNNREFVL